MFKTARVLFSIFLLLIASFLFLKPAFAQTIPANTNPDVPKNLHTWTQTVMIEVASSLSCLISGVDPIDPTQRCLGVDVRSGKIGYVDSGGGAIGTMGNLIAATFTPPASSSDFTRYLAGNFGLVKPAYAQNGIGFTGLAPILQVWIAFRNLAYLLFVLIFVVIGFAIMLRIHIDPRTVMTIENQIPKIIVGLVFVTFSFAIAGFLIDLMYVLTYLAINIFNSMDIQGFRGTIGPAFSDVQGRTVFEVANNMPFATQQPSGLLGIITGASNAVRDMATNLFTQQGGLLDTISKIPLAGGALGGLGNAFVSFLAFIIIGVAVLFALSKLWFELIKAYIFIILDIVLAPFWILAGLLPGSNFSFTAWLRDLSAQLLAFPATIIMFLLGKVLIDGVSQGPGFFPPLIGNPGSPRTVAAILGLGIILLTPSVVNMMKAALKAPKLDLSAIGQAVGVGMGYPISVGKGVTGIYGQAREYRVKSYDDATGKVGYGTTGPFRAIFNRFGR